MTFFPEIKTYTLKLCTYVLIKSGFKIIQTTSNDSLKAKVKFPMHNIQGEILPWASMGRESLKFLR